MGLARPITIDPNFKSPLNFRITGDRWIEEAEYFIDIDPGEGNGIFVPPADGAFDGPEETLLFTDIDVSIYAAGPHILYLRVKDNEGTWGITKQFPFEVFQPAKIEAAEYFIDDDPGPGNGIDLPPKDGQFNSTEEEVDLAGIDLSAYTEDTHTLYVRFRDSLGRWGSSSIHPFSINRPITFTPSNPLQPADGSGILPLTITVADQSGSNTCKLKIEYALNGSGNWKKITIDEASVAASYGSPSADNSAEYQIGGSQGWIETSNGPNTISFVWLANLDIGQIEASTVNIRFTIDNGAAGQSTSTTSSGFSLDTKAPAIPNLIPYLPDPTGDTTPTLRWYAVDETDQYHLQIAIDPDFNNIVLDVPNVTVTSYTPQLPLPYGQVYWRVSAVDSWSNSSPYSTADSFIVSQDSEPPSVTLSYSDPSPVTAGPLTFVATFSEPLATVPKISIDQPGSMDVSAINMESSGDVWTFNYPISCANGGSYIDGTVMVSITDGFDYAGNENLPAQNNSFVIDTSGCGSGNIADAEYFFDMDPGEGNGFVLPAADGTFDSPEESVDFNGIDLSGLKIGEHTIYVRFKNANGVWGLARPITIDPDFKSPFNFRITGDRWIEAAEYFVNIDPGEGNGIPVTAADGAFDGPEEDLLLTDLDVSIYATGMHTLYLRVKDNEGTWGIVRQVPFEVYHPATIESAEYFIDDDPGPGNGIPLPPKDRYFNSDQEEVELSGIDLSAYTEDTHTLYVRFKDSLGRWGSVSSAEFNYGGQVADADSDGIPDDQDPDDDNDGMPDEWELLYPGLDPYFNDADGDLDGDGLSNLEEYENQTNPLNPDTDQDGISDADEINHGNNPNGIDDVSLEIQGDDVLVSLTGNNTVYVRVSNRFIVPKAIQFELTGIDPTWYSIDAQDLNFILLPFGTRTIPIEMHLPLDCGITAGSHGFVVTAHWQHGGTNYESSDQGNLVITPDPNIYKLAIPEDTRLAGNSILVAWKTDIPTDSYLYYRKLGDLDYTQVVVATDATEHRFSLDDLEWFVFYEFYTENHSDCGGYVKNGPYLVKTGKAVKFAGGVNEFWIDRDYNQQVTLSITNTDQIEHTYDLSVINDNADLVVGFVGDGSNGRQSTLQPGETKDVELVIHAPDAQKTLYDIYLKIVSDKDEFDAFVDYSHAIIHVRSFVTNLDLQQVASTPGMMTYEFTLINYGDTLTDIEVYVDDNSQLKTWMDQEYHQLRLETGQSVPIVIHAQEHITGTLYARSGSYIVSAPFEIGCPDGTSLNTYTLNNVPVVAQIKDWYCTNKEMLHLPFTIPQGFGINDILSAFLEVNFSLPMAINKYDPHTVVMYINDHIITRLEDTIPSGQYKFRFPASFIHTGLHTPARNYLTLVAEGIGNGQYLVATDFNIVLNIGEMDIDLCVPPPSPVCQLPQGCIPPDPETKIMGVGPETKFRPGNIVPVTVTLQNTDSIEHHGQLVLTITNNSNNSEQDTKIITEDVIIPPGPFAIPDALPEEVKSKYNFNIDSNEDDVEFTISAVFDNFTLNESVSLLNRPAFYVRTPLVIVHGIMGSELRDSVGNVLWSTGTIALPCDNTLDNLLFNTAGYPIQGGIKATHVIRKGFTARMFGHDLFTFKDIFYGLENYLKRNRYKIYLAGTGIKDAPEFSLNDIFLNENESEDLFYFVYDWRYENVIAANNLEAFIDAIITTQGYGKVNLLAHSMGGLVCKTALKQSSDLDGKVNKVIYIGTPNIGAVEAFTVMKHGLNAPKFGQTIYVDNIELASRVVSAIDLIQTTRDALDNPISLQALSTILGLVKINEQIVDPNACSDAIKITKAILSVINLFHGHVRSALITLFDYYNCDKDLDGIRDSQAKKLSETLPSMHQLLPSEQFFTHVPHGYYSFNDMPVDTYPEMFGQLSGWFNVTMLSEAESFHNDIDFLPIKENSYAIVGCKKCTTNYLEETYNPFLCLTFNAGDGDGTVPVDSALDINVQKKYAAKYAEHSNLPSHPGVQFLVRSLLKGFEDGFPVSPFYPVSSYQEGICGAPTCSTGGKFIIPIPKLSLRLPEFKLIDIPTGDTTWISPNGVRIGILGSDYRVTNEGIEIYIPDGSAYTLDFHGIDTEYLDIKFQMMIEGGGIKTYVYTDITLDMGACGQVTFDLTNVLIDPVLRIDNQCDGTFEQENITPSYVLDENESSDATPPTTSVDISGSLGTNDWYFSDITVTLNANDSGGSGILATRFRFSGDANYSEYSVPLSVTDPGIYELYYYSVDRNLNEEIEKVLTVKIDDGSPPHIISTVPIDQSPNTEKISDVRIRFSEPIDVSSTIEDDIVVLGSISGEHSGLISFNSAGDELTFTPDEPFVLGENVSVTAKGTITDLAGMGLDGNGNNASEGSPVDDYSWPFMVTEYDGLNVQITNIDKMSCPSIIAPVIVTGDGGTIVPDLIKENFSVYEDGFPVMEFMVEFVDQSSSPISVSLALDYSGSMSTTAITDMENAAIEFVSTMGEQDESEIVKFADGVEVSQAHTTDKTVLINSINAATALPRSATHLYDAIYQAISDTTLREGRKAVIVMTDGADNGSTYSDTDVITCSIAEAVPIFTVGLGDSIDATVLQAIADQTGGVYYEAPTSDELQAIYQAISDVLKNQYIVTYTTPYFDDIEHSLQILASIGPLSGSDTSGFPACSTCLGDLTQDSDVDGADLVEFINAYQNVHIDADLNGDNIIDSQDIDAFAHDFGRLCNP